MWLFEGFSLIWAFLELGFFGNCFFFFNLGFLGFGVLGKLRGSFWILGFLGIRGLFGFGGFFRSFLGLGVFNIFLKIWLFWGFRIFLGFEFFLNVGFI